MAQPGHADECISHMTDLQLASVNVPVLQWFQLDEGWPNEAGKFVADKATPLLLYLRHLLGQDERDDILDGPPRKPQKSPLLKWIHSVTHHPSELPYDPLPQQPRKKLPFLQWLQDLSKGHLPSQPAAKSEATVPVAGPPSDAAASRADATPSICPCTVATSSASRKGVEDLLPLAAALLLLAAADAAIRAGFNPFFALHSLAQRAGRIVTAAAQRTADKVGAAYSWSRERAQELDRRFQVRRHVRRRWKPYLAVLATAAAARAVSHMRSPRALDGGVVKPVRVIEPAPARARNGSGRAVLATVASFAAVEAGFRLSESQAFQKVRGDVTDAVAAKCQQAAQSLGAVSRHVKANWGRIGAFVLLAFATEYASRRAGGGDAVTTKQARPDSRSRITYQAMFCSAVLGCYTAERTLRSNVNVAAALKSRALLLKNSIAALDAKKQAAKLVNAMAENWREQKMMWGAAVAMWLLAGAFKQAHEDGYLLPKFMTQYGPRLPFALIACAAAHAAVENPDKVARHLEPISRRAQEVKDRMVTMGSGALSEGKRRTTAACDRYVGQPIASGATAVRGWRQAKRRRAVNNMHAYSFQRPRTQRNRILLGAGALFFLGPRAVSLLANLLTPRPSAPRAKPDKPAPPSAVVALVPDAQQPATPQGTADNASAVSGVAPGGVPAGEAAGAAKKPCCARARVVRKKRSAVLLPTAVALCAASHAVVHYRRKNAMQRRSLGAADNGKTVDGSDGPAVRDVYDGRGEMHWPARFTGRDVVLAVRRAGGFVLHQGARALNALRNASASLGMHVAAAQMRTSMSLPKYAHVVVNAQDYGGGNPDWIVRPLAQAGLITSSAMHARGIVGDMLQPISMIKSEALLSVEEQLDKILQELPTSLDGARRSLFMLEDDVCYLNHGSYGAVLKATAQSANLWRQHMESQPSRFFEEDAVPALVSALRKTAAFVGASVADVAPITNATSGITLVLRSLRLQPGDMLLVMDCTYPAIKSAAAAAAAAHGASILELQTDLDCLLSPARLEDRLRTVLEGAGGRIKAAILDHIVSFPPVVLPVQEMARVCRMYGALAIIDGAHAIGNIPLNLPSIGADVYVTNCHKWLCTPKGTALLWASKDVQAMLKPLVVSHGAGLGFSAELWWSGTADVCNWLSVPVSVEAFTRLDPASIHIRNAQVLQHGVEMLCDAFGLNRSFNPMELPPVVGPVRRGSQYGATSLVSGWLDTYGAASMAAVQLPPIHGFSATPPSAQALRRHLRRQFGIEVPVAAFADVLWVRVSVALYTEVADFATLAAAVCRLAGLPPPLPFPGPDKLRAPPRAWDSIDDKKPDVNVDVTLHNSLNYPASRSSHDAAGSILPVESAPSLVYASQESFSSRGDPHLIPYDSHDRLPLSALRFASGVRESTSTASGEPHSVGPSASHAEPGVLERAPRTLNVLTPLASRDSSQAVDAPTDTSHDDTEPPSPQLAPHVCESPIHRGAATLPSCASADDLAASGATIDTQPAAAEVDADDASPDLRVHAVLSSETPREYCSARRTEIFDAAEPSLPQLSPLSGRKGALAPSSPPVHASVSSSQVSIDEHMLLGEQNPSEDQLATMSSAGGDFSVFRTHSSSGLEAAPEVQRVEGVAVPTAEEVRDDDEATEEGSGSQPEVVGTSQPSGDAPGKKSKKSKKKKGKR